MRRARSDEVEPIKWALYAALDWSPERQLPPFEPMIERPVAAIYLDSRS